MSEVLRVNDVGKAYSKWSSEWLRVLSWLGLKAKPETLSWVVRGVSFDLPSGESLAIIGQNGAGKSTLLKIITGTILPTTGTVVRNGRVAAILELGMGFNQEMTGRENVRHVAGLMGYGLEQIEAKLPEIEDFAEIGSHFDQPVRTYSSGMQMRVAFAVVTAWRPDILIIDEALSVGDSYFQHKSFDRIREFKDAGTSLLFVSHSMQQVRSLCDRAILLFDGSILKDGLPDEVADFYNALVAAKENELLTIEQRRDRDGWLYTRSGTGGAAISSLRLVDRHTGEEVKLAKVGQSLRLLVDVEIAEAIPTLVFGCMIRDRQGHVIWGSNTWHTKQKVEAPAVGSRMTFCLDFECNLGPGSYSFSPALVSSDTHLDQNFEWVDNALVFDVFNADRDLFIGTAALDATFHVGRP